MTKQSLSDRQRKWLVTQIDDWKSKGLLSEDQVARVLDLYESPGDLLERHRSKAIFTLMGIAALLVGLGAACSLCCFGSHLVWDGGARLPDPGSMVFWSLAIHPNGAYSALLLAVPGFLWAYRNQSIATLYLYVPLVAWRIILQPFAWQTFEGSHYFAGGV